MRVQRDFSQRSAFEQDWLVENTWCDACGEADLGLVDPVEYEEIGRIFLEGACARCGARVVSEIRLRESEG
jgi:hypothetical protein